MSNTVATIDPPRQKSVLFDMANRFGMEAQAFEMTVRATCMPTGRDVKPATREEFAAFLLVAKEYELNPLLKEIYAFPRRGGGIVPVVSIDGWVNLINKHPMCDGFEFEWEHDGQRKPVSCTCKMYRKDRSHPTTVTEYYDECFRPTDPWKMAHRMLRHKALIQAARYAFGFAGIYDEDEAARIAQMKDVTPQTERPKLSDYREQEAEPTDVEPEPETDSGDPFFFTDVFGEKDEEPLDEGDFYRRLTEALDESVERGVPQAIETLTMHNQDGIDRLSEQGKDLLLEAIDQANKRLRGLAVEREKETSKKAQAEKKTEKEAAKEDGSEEPENAEEPAEDSAEEDAAEQEPPPSESENPAPAEEPSRVIPLQFADSGVPREKAYFGTLNKAFKDCASPAEVRATWAANKADIGKCSNYWQKEVEKAAKERVEALEKEPD